MRLGAFLSLTFLGLLSCEPSGPMADYVTIENNPQEKASISKYSYTVGRKHLKTNADAYYEAKALEVLEVKDRTLPKSFSNLDLKKLVQSIRQKRNVAIVTFKHLDYQTSNIEIMSEPWHFKKNLWQPIRDFNNTYYRSRFVNLNHDSHSDVIIQGGCCDSNTVNVFLGTENDLLKYTQNISIIGLLIPSLKGPCEKAVIIAKNYLEEEIALKFNCQTNRFEEPKEKDE